LIRGGIVHNLIPGPETGVEAAAEEEEEEEEEEWAGALSGQSAAIAIAAKMVLEADIDVTQSTNQFQEAEGRSRLQMLKERSQARRSAATAAEAALSAAQSAVSSATALHKAAIRAHIQTATVMASTAARMGAVSAAALAGRAQDTASMAAAISAVVADRLAEELAKSNEVKAASEVVEPCTQAEQQIHPKRRGPTAAGRAAAVAATHTTETSSTLEAQANSVHFSSNLQFPQYSRSPKVNQRAAEGDPTPPSSRRMMDYSRTPAAVVLRSPTDEGEVPMLGSLSGRRLYESLEPRINFDDV
jgi:hypothetical protein